MCLNNPEKRCIVDHLQQNETTAVVFCFLRPFCSHLNKLYNHEHLSTLAHSYYETDQNERRDKGGGNSHSKNACIRWTVDFVSIKWLAAFNVYLELFELPTYPKLLNMQYA